MFQYNLASWLSETTGDVPFFAEVRSLLKEELPCLYPFLSVYERN